MQLFTCLVLLLTIKVWCLAGGRPPGRWFPWRHLQLGCGKWRRHLLILRPLPALQSQREGLHPNLHRPDGHQHLRRLLLEADDDVNRS